MPTFIVSDESVNRYGYRVLTAGIDIEQFKRNPVLYYLHDRDEKRSNKDRIAVVGRWENIKKVDGKLYADPVFDEEDPLGKELKRKVEKGFIKMASIGIDPQEFSDKPIHLVAGQTRPTVVKSELLEISIVDRGGNNNALMLMDDEGHRMEVDKVLPKLASPKDTNQKSDMSDLKSLAPALELSADAGISDYLAKITKLSADSKELKQLKEVEKAKQNKEALELTDQLVTKGLLPESLKALQLKAFEEDFDKAKANVSELLKVEAPAGGSQQLADFMTERKGADAATPEKETFEYLSEHNPKKLALIQKDNPQKFEKLLAEYESSTNNI